LQQKATIRGKNSNWWGQKEQAKKKKKNDNNQLAEDYKQQ